MNQSVEQILSQGVSSFLDYASIGIVLVDRNLNIILANNFACNLFEYNEKELFDQKIDVLIPSRYHHIHARHHALFNQHPQNRPMGLGMDLYGLRKSGKEFPVEISLGTYKIKDELYIIAFINDITFRKENENKIIRLNAELEQKVLERTEALADAVVRLQRQIKETEEAEAELEKALAKEKELSLLKSRFVSMASHEFRTPLSTIHSSAYLLEKYTSAEDQDKRNKHIQRIVTAVNSLVDILDDFLNVGKIEEGKIAPNWMDIDIEEFTETTINQINPLLKKGQTIKYEHTGIHVIRTDSTMVRQILINLLSNAIKFSDENKVIHISTRVYDKEWILSVKDQGIGIAKHEQKNLFERFYRASNASNIKGTGLGLHIIMRYAQLLHGNIHCESELGVGSEFIARFIIE